MMADGFQRVGIDAEDRVEDGMVLHGIELGHPCWDAIWPWCIVRFAPAQQLSDIL